MEIECRCVLADSTNQLGFYLSLLCHYYIPILDKYATELLSQHSHFNVLRE